VELLLGEGAGAGAGAAWQVEVYDMEPKVFAFIAYISVEVDVEAQETRAVTAYGALVPVQAAPVKIVICVPAAEHEVGEVNNKVPMHEPNGVKDQPIAFADAQPVATE